MFRGVSMSNGRRMNPITIGKLFTLLIVVSLAFVYLPDRVDAQAGGIGVSNDPPSMVDVFVDDHNGLIMVHISLRDLNGWSDIYNITLVVLDGNGQEICNITYKQYTDLDATIAVIDWVETTGNYWDEDSSGYLPVHVDEWEDNSIGPIGLNVSFALTPFSGEVIKIDAYDMKEARCGYQGPFSADYEIPPYFDEDVNIPIGISFMAAIIGAGFIVYRRMNSNKLAKLIETGK